MFKITIQTKTGDAFSVERRVNAHTLTPEGVRRELSQGKYVSIIATAGTKVPDGFLMKGAKDKHGKWQPLIFSDGSFPIYLSNVEIVETF